MYKLIIGNVRVTVLSEDINRDQVTTMVRQALATASRQGKLLSHIEISSGEYGPELKTSEKIGHKVVRKTIKQSMLDSMHIAVREKLFPNNAFANRDSWFDGDTGQEWFGEAVDLAREEIMAKLEAWMKTV